jgi:predicted lipid carrier protein YhbT
MNNQLTLHKKMISLLPVSPAFWRLPFKLVPQPVQIYALQKAANLLLKEQLDDGDLDFLDGPFLRIQVRDLGYDWGVCKRGDRLMFFPGVEGADVSFSGTSSDLLLLASRREDADTLFFQRRLRIEGDTELGLQIKNLIDAIDLEQFPALFNRALNFGADLVEAAPARS